MNAKNSLRSLLFLFFRWLCFTCSCSHNHGSGKWLAPRLIVFFTIGSFYVILTNCCSLPWFMQDRVSPLPQTKIGIKSVLPTRNCHATARHGSWARRLCQDSPGRFDQNQQILLQPLAENRILLRLGIQQVFCFQHMFWMWRSQLQPFTHEQMASWGGGWMNLMDIICTPMKWWKRKKDPIHITMKLYIYNWKGAR